MVERRLELFYALLDVLGSMSPTIVTSRPGYFVERGELDSLLTMLSEQESEISARSHDMRAFPAADALRRTIVRRHRDKPPMNADKALDARGVDVVRLLPLDRDRIEAFLQRRAADLVAAGTSPEAVIAFIDRTYNLADLASRPMLLELIVTSVLLNQLDLDDTEVQYGASGLYEIYTHAKLDLDLAKGRTRKGGLPLETRRMLAEALALEMYRQSTLELDFDEVLDRLMAEEGDVRDALAVSGLTADEIATDLATCSFLTLDEDGRARFIHKSFRGFFVARVLKEDLSQPMLAEPLEREVLYFLGGFAPTQPRVGEGLWAAFLRADAGASGRRRNLLVAYLYTRPDHGSRRILDGEIGGAEFRRLAFDKSRMINTSWVDCTVMELDLQDVDWRDVRLFDSHVSELRMRGGKLVGMLARSFVESLEMSGASVRIEPKDASVQSWMLTDAQVAAAPLDSHVEDLKAQRSVLTSESLAVHVGHAVIVDSHLRVGDVTSLEATRSVVTSARDQAAALSWKLDRSLLVFDGSLLAPGTTNRGSVAFGSTAPSDSESIVLAPGGIAHSLLTGLPCGVFGSVKPASGREPLRPRPTAGGVLEASEILSQSNRTSGATGRRHGNLLLVRRDWYEVEVARDGRLSAIYELERLAAESPELGAVSAAADRLGELLDLARRQFVAVAHGSWPVFEQSR
jgi:hypothetical protein